MPAAYTSLQKNAIGQFVSFTQVDKTTAARLLKAHGWDVQNAVNAEPDIPPQAGPHWNKMFGSSQDRARQLAARKRRERIVSNSSLGSYRSVSTTSQQSQASSTWEQQNQRFGPRISNRQSNAEVSSQVTVPVAQPSSTMDRSTWESQGMRSIASTPHLHYPQRFRYAGLGSNLMTSRHTRHVTDSFGVYLSPTKASASPYTMANLSLLPAASTIFHDRVYAQTTVSLRGGFGDESAADQAADATLLAVQYKVLCSEYQATLYRNRFYSIYTASGQRRPYVEKFPYVVNIRNHHLWGFPILDLFSISALFALLSTDEQHRFRWLYGSELCVTSPLDMRPIRQAFYAGLNFEQRYWFRMLIIRRCQTLLLTNHSYCSPTKETLRQVPSYYFDKDYPRILLPLLLEATEPRTESTAQPIDPHVQPMLPATSVSAITSAMWTLPPRSFSSPSLPVMAAPPRSGALHGPMTYFGGSVAAAGPSPAKAALSKLFDHYKLPSSEADTLAVESIMPYFQDIDVDVAGLESLAVLEVVKSPSMGEISRDGFVNGWADVNCDTIDKQKAYVQTLKFDLASKKDLFTKVYKYSFITARQAGQKAVALDIAIAYWDLLFDSPLTPVSWRTQTSPWIDWWKEFLEASWKKSVNKDMWNETLKFANLTLSDEAISFWNEESSWPSVIDDFVDFVKKEKRGETQADTMEY